ncbi:hypothetical protein [Pseudokineococcus marinus]|nr:hypothetical protein [Pseudokineococcus marinus]NNH24472.1 hypothetical protein [Pseudokineococcus marinus]
MWPLNTAALAAGSVLADEGRHVALTGAGLMPAEPSTAPLLRRLLRGYAVVDVRDEPTRALLEGLSATRLSGDDALLALDDAPSGVPGGGHSGGPGDGAGAAGGPWAPPEGLPPTMLCVQSDVVAPEDLPALAALVLDQLDRWGVRGEELGVLECVPRVDRWVWDAVVAPHLPGARFLSLGEVLDRGFPARPGQRWLTTRYHPHLLAAARGASGVAVDVAPDYYGHKHRALQALGSPFEVRALRPAAGAPLPAPAAPAGAGWDLSGPVRDKHRLAEQVHAAPDAAPHVAPHVDGHRQDDDRREDHRHDDHRGTGHGADRSAGLGGRLRDLRGRR